MTSQCLSLGMRAYALVLYCITSLVLSVSTVSAGPYSDAVTADTPIAYYRFDETTGTVAANTGTASGIDATYVNISTGANPSLIGQAGPRPGDPAGTFSINNGFEADNRSLFVAPADAQDASNFPRAEVSVPDDSATSPLALSGGLTLEAWIRHSGDTINTGDNEGIVGRYLSDQNGPARSYLIYYDSTAETDAGVGAGLGFAFSSDGSFNPANSKEFLAPVNVGEWGHVALVHENSGRSELYFNGQSIGDFIVPAGSLYTGEGDLWIGQQFNEASNNTFQGNIDEVAIYDRPLSDAEVLAHFEAATDGVARAFSWASSESDDWNDSANWTSGTIPNTNERTAVFGGAIVAPRTVYSNAPITVQGLRFANINSYAVAGTGTITLSAAIGSASIDVAAGSHELQAAVTLGSDTDIDAVGGAIEINNVLNIGSHTLSVGAGSVSINHSVVAGAGGKIVVSSPGILGTAGETSFGGDLSSTGELHIDIGGTDANEFDILNVAGTATLSGLLDVELVDGFTLAGDEEFTVLTSGTLVDDGIALTAEAAGLFDLLIEGQNLVLKALQFPTGDYNRNGIVDAADYALWLNTLGSTTDLRANGDDTGASAGVIDLADYEAWRTNFGNVASSAAETPAPVPEPSGIVLAGLAIAFLVGLRPSGRLTKRWTLSWRNVLAYGAVLACSMSPVAKAGPYSDAVIADNPLLYYRFSESDPNNDFFAINSGTGGIALEGAYNQFIGTGGPGSLGEAGPRPGDTAGGFPIDGLETDNLAPHWDATALTHVVVPDFTAPALDVTGIGTPGAGGTGLTLEAWINRDTNTTSANNEAILAKWDSSTGRSYTLSYDTRGASEGLNFFLSGDGSFDANLGLYAGGAITPGEWIHVAGTWTPGESVRLYVNGQEVGSNTDAAITSLPSIHNSTTDFVVGWQFQNLGLDSLAFEGRIDEPAVYDRALSAAEILEHFEAATDTFDGVFTWNVNGSGSWDTAENWDPASVPNGSQQMVVFGDAVTSPQTVIVDLSFTVGSVQFDNANSYALAGNGVVQLVSAAGNASISVEQGDHEFQAQVRLGSDTDVNANAGSISFNNVLDLNGYALNIQSGTANIRNLVLPGDGGVINNAAALAIEGDAVIAGDFVSTGLLAFDIGGTAPGDYDSLKVGGTARLSGDLGIGAVDGYSPSDGDTFTLLTAEALFDEGLSLTGPLANTMQLSVVGNTLVLQAVAIPEPATLVLLSIIASIFLGFRRHGVAQAARRYGKMSPGSF